MSKTSKQAVAILAIEDDPGDFGLFRAYVSQAELGVRDDSKFLIWAKNLAEGIAAARNDEPDIVLLDLSLPDSTGLDTVQAMRAALPGVPIVVLTGHDDHALAAAALQSGAQDYLVKGQFDHDALGRTVRHALGRLLQFVYEATCRFTCVTACSLAVWKLTTTRYHVAASSCYRGVRTIPRTGLKPARFTAVTANGQARLKSCQSSCPQPTEGATTRNPRRTPGCGGVLLQRVLSMLLLDAINGVCHDMPYEGNASIL